MQDETLLVEVKTENFSAVVLSFGSQPLEDLFDVIGTYTSEDVQETFELCLAMFIDNLAPDKLDDFYSMDEQEIIQLIAQWIGKA